MKQFLMILLLSDFCHGQTGRAPNCVEGHPAFGFRVVSDISADDDDVEVVSLKTVAPRVKPKVESCPKCGCCKPDKRECHRLCPRVRNHDMDHMCMELCERPISPPKWSLQEGVTQ